MFKLNITNFQIAVLTLIALPNFSWSTPASLPTVSIKYCYDGDTCTTLKGEKIRLACIDTPELKGKKKGKSIPAKLAEEFLNDLVAKKKFLLEGLPKIDTAAQ